MGRSWRYWPRLISDVRKLLLVDFSSRNLESWRACRSSKERWVFSPQTNQLYSATLRRREILLFGKSRLDQNYPTQWECWRHSLVALNGKPVDPATTGVPRVFDRFFSRVGYGCDTVGVKRS